jgi:hypothetical protein
MSVLTRDTPFFIVTAVKTSNLAQTQFGAIKVLRTIAQAVVLLTHYRAAKLTYWVIHNKYDLSFPCPPLAPTNKYWDGTSNENTTPLHIPSEPVFAVIQSLDTTA